ncbi:hypothetical protein BVG19_g698 [[Candida] boidinii]|nr:hypothetical protein BVG19_g698 [[Candida] boidinii]OWB49294.1 hypothetical protein B5S27_g834 [[Candida] boidinii]
MKKIFSRKDKRRSLVDGNKSDPPSPSPNHHQLNSNNDSLSFPGLRRFNSNNSTTSGATTSTSTTPVSATATNSNNNNSNSLQAARSHSQLNHMMNNNNGHANSSNQIHNSNVGAASSSSSSWKSHLAPSKNDKLNSKVTETHQQQIHYSDAHNLRNKNLVRQQQSSHHLQQQQPQKQTSQSQQQKTQPLTLSSATIHSSTPNSMDIDDHATISSNASIANSKYTMDQQTLSASTISHSDYDTNSILLNAGKNNTSSQFKNQTNSSNTNGGNLSTTLTNATGSTAVNSILTNNTAASNVSASSNTSNTSTPSLLKKSYLSTKKTTAAAFSPKKVTAPPKALAVSSLVDATWDQEVLKIGWLNRGSTIAFTSEEHLRFCRVELKGCNLNVYKPTGDVTEVRLFRPTLTNVTSPTNSNNNHNGNNSIYNSRTNTSNISLNNSASSLNNISSLSSASSSASIIDNNGTSSSLVNDNSSVANMSIRGLQLDPSASLSNDPNSQKGDVSDTISINSFATVGAKSTMTNGLQSNDHNEKGENDQNDNNDHDNELDDLQSIQTSKFGNLQTESTDSLDVNSLSQKKNLIVNNSNDELSNENSIIKSTDLQNLTSDDAKDENIDGDDVESQAGDVDERQTFMSASHLSTAPDSIMEEEDNNDKITTSPVDENQKNGLEDAKEENLEIIDEKYDCQLSKKEHSYDLQNGAQTSIEKSGNTIESNDLLVDPISKQHELNKSKLLNMSLDNIGSAISVATEASENHPSVSVNQNFTVPLSNASASASVSASASASATAASVAAAQAIIIENLSYNSIQYPHPDLEIDNESNSIVTGSLESVCHAVLFNPYNNLSIRLLEVLPLFSEVLLAISYFIKYSDTFVSEKHVIPEEECIIITDEEENLMSDRLAVVIEYITEHFSGMLLEESIYKSLWNLIFSLEKHTPCENLKKSIYQRQQQLYNLTDFDPPSKGAISSSSNLTIPSVPSSTSLSQFSAKEFVNCNLDELALEINAISLKFTKIWDAKKDLSLLYETTHNNYSYYRKNPLIFNVSKNIHYLGRLFIYHLFQDPLYRSDPQLRARVLTKWIELGSYFDRMGDMVSWLAISTLVCSIPVLRLRSTWSYIDEGYVKLVSTNWSPVVFELDRRSLISTTTHKNSYHILAPRGIGTTYAKENVVPYFGDLFIKKTQPIKYIILVSEKHVQKIYTSFERWNEYLDSVKNDSSLSVSPDDQCGKYSSNLAAKLQSLLKYHVSCAPITIEDVMEQSLIVEPSYNGQFHKYHNSSRSPLFLGSYASIVFPSILDTYQIYDQNVLLGALGVTGFNNASYKKTIDSQILSVKDSDMATLAGSTSNLISEDHILDENASSSILDSSTGINSSAPLKAIHSKNKEKSRKQFLKNVRDLFNIDSTEFHFDDSIIFKTINEKIGQSEEDNEEDTDHPKESSVTTTDTNKDTVVETANTDRENDKEKSAVAANKRSSSNSFRNSILFGESNNIKRFSSYSSSSFNLEEFSTTPVLTSEKEQESTSDAGNNEESKEDEEDKDLAEKKTVIEIFTKSASVERLLDLLCLTSSIFCSGLDEEDVKKFIGSDKLLESLVFKMDNGIFTVTFFATYRGFCSTSKLLQGLTRRFIGAKSAALSISKRINSESSSADNFINFPDWDSPVTSVHEQLEQINWTYVAQIQIGVLETLVILVDNFFEHFLDDLHSKNTFDSLLRIIDNEIVIQWTRAICWLEVNKKETTKVQSLYEKIKQQYNKMRKAYIKKSYQPQVLTLQVPRFSSDIPEIPADSTLPADNKSIEKFVISLDSLIASLVKRISSNDWVDTFEILEVQGGKSPLSLFNYDIQRLETSEGSLAISNIFSWLSTLLDLEPENDKDQSYFVHKLPTVLKGSLQLYFKIQYFFRTQIVDPLISTHERITRMANLLKMLQIVRIKMKALSLFDESSFGKSSSFSSRVPSFLESCISNTIVLPESRAFMSSWIKAANSLRDSPIESYATLNDLLPDEDNIAPELVYKSSLTPCVGWVIERLLEIACYIPNMSVENTSLINFDKRRFAYNCICNITDMVALSSMDEIDEISESEEDTEGGEVTVKSTTPSFEFLFGLKMQPIDMKQALEYAAKENNETDLDLTDNVLFKQHIEEQYMILKLEHSKKALLFKQEAELISNSKFSNNGIITSSLTSRTAITAPEFLPPTVGRHSRRVPHATDKVAHKNSRFKLSGLLNKASRPFSLNMGGFNQTTPHKIVDAIDLPMASAYSDSKIKPYLTINLKDHSSFAVYSSAASFKINKISSNIEYFFQSMSDTDRDDWIYRLNFARKHWYWSKICNKSTSSKVIFGMPIEYVCAREKTFIPKIIEKILCEIEYRGLEEVGIYRKSASIGVLTKIKNEIDNTSDYNMENQMVFDIHNLTGCIKTYLRELPDPLIPDELVPDFARIRDDGNSSSRFDIYHQVLPKLPTHNYYFLERLIRHLKLVDDYKDFNKMNSANLATVLGGVFIEGARPETMRRYFGVMNFICDDMIRNYDSIFISE